MEKTFLVTCELGYEDQTVSDLNQLPGVDASRLAGAYDIIAKVNAESTESLTKVIRIGDKETKQSSVNTDIRFNPQFDVDEMMVETDFLVRNQNRWLMEPRNHFLLFP
jgi:hypothetical protein